MRIVYLLFLLILSCANVTPEGRKVHLIETTANSLYEAQTIADEYSHKHDCTFVGYVDASSAHFPGSYSIHENEIHTALRNRAAKMGVNVVVANFYKKPAQGVGLQCPEDRVMNKVFTHSTL